MQLRFNLILGVILLPLWTRAQSDFDVAQAFMVRKGVTIEEQPSTKGDADPYCIFHGVDGRGFVIVKDGVIVGYSTNTTANSCPVRANTRSFEPTPKTPIEPLVKAQWGQDDPFNRLCPILDNGVDKHPVLAGCGATAFAQILHYYKNEGCDSLEECRLLEVIPGIDKSRILAPVLEALPPTRFHWDLMPPKYDDFTEEQADEVAKLMKYVGYAVKTCYWKNGEAGTALNPKDFTPLGFSDESYSTSDLRLRDEEIEALFDKELEQGRPVLLAGYTADLSAGHWFVVDGRDDTGRYHLNTGHCGEGDGYYIISQELYEKAFVEFLETGRPFWMIVQEKGLTSYNSNPYCVVPIMPSDWVIPQTTGIKSPRVIKSDAVYNLQGRMVGRSPDGLPKGIYIQNDQKLTVK